MPVNNEKTFIYKEEGCPDAARYEACLGHRSEFGVWVNAYGVVCDSCEESKYVVFDFDTSGEYGTMSICEDCLHNAVAKAKELLEEEQANSEQD